MKDKTQKPQIRIKATVNFRPIVAMAIAMMLAIFAYVYKVAFLCVLAMIALAVLLIATKDGDKRIVYVLLLVAVVTGTLSPLAVDFRNSFRAEQVKGDITATVYSVDENGKYMLENVTVDGKKLGNGELKLGYGYMVGDKLSFYGGGYLDNSTSTTLYKKGGLFEKANYYMYAVGEVEKLEDRSISLPTAVRETYKTAMMKYMSKDSFASFYGMLFGDTSYMDDGKLQLLRLSGIAHIFAVSGLHVAVLYGAILGLLKNARPKVKAAVILPIIYFYAYVCGLTPSVIRATIMLTVDLFSRLLGKHKDKPTTLAASAVFALAYNPYSMFSASFILSFAIVGTIYMADSWVKRLIPKKLFGGMLNVSFSATLGSLPLSSYFFGNISFISLILNVLLIPMLSTLFICVLALVPLTAISGINFLVVIDIVYTLTAFCVNLLAASGIGIIKHTLHIVPTILIFVSYFMLSEYYIMERKTKTNLALVVLVIALILALVL